MIPRVAAALFVLSVSACASAPRPTTATSAPPPAGWVDPSPHQIRFVTVAPGIRLELLDWGGDGPPLIFLAGLTNSAHVFDDFAPAFRDPQTAEHAGEQRDRFRREVPRGRVVEIRDANHYVFISHPALVLKEVRAFLTS